MPLPFSRFCCDPAPVCSIQPHHQPPCPLHLSSAHASSLLAQVFLLSPRDCNGEVETGYSSQVAAPPFGGAGWTARTCAPEPALLTAQPAVTKASSRAISMPSLSHAGLEQMHTLFGHPCAWTTRQHQQKDRDMDGAPGEGGDCKPWLSQLLEHDREPKSHGWACALQTAAKAQKASSPSPRFGSPCASCLHAARKGPELRRNNSSRAAGSSSLKETWGTETLQEYYLSSVSRQV